MPREDGFAVCRRIRSLTEAPILFLSARTDEAAVAWRGWVSGRDFFIEALPGGRAAGAGGGTSAAAERTPAHRMVRSGVALT